MSGSLLSFFTDPVLRAPTIGSILMCITSSMVGVIVLLRKRSLIGESLSHASYPGIVLGVIIGSIFFSPYSSYFSLSVLFFAGLSSLIGLFLIEGLEKRLRVRDDAALCFILSLFFGVGILLASRIQTTHALWYRQVQSFLYGQTATMLDMHVYIYLALFIITLLAILYFRKELQIVLFDRNFGKSIGLSVKKVELVTTILTVMAVVIGLRCVGVVMMAGMLIAPALSARFLTKRLSSLFWVAAIVGALSGFLGNVFSLHLPTLFSLGHVALPTGPMILLSASSFCFAALLFSPEKGLLKRICRAYRFRRNCQMDNFLKYLWKEGGRVVASTPFLSSSCHIIGSSRFSLMHRLKRKGLILIWEGSICLTEKGRQKAERIVRLHRLWELYLVQLGCSKDKVHASAEEMEHVLTPEIEAQLMRMLDNPEFDPHNQPIPKTL